jgi:hypothetical protein
MNDVAKYYTPLTPFLEKWDETANQDDFAYFAVMGTLMEAEETAEKANLKTGNEIDAKVSRLQLEIENIEQNIKTLQKQYSVAPHGKKKYISSNIKAEKSDAKQLKKIITKLKEDKAILGTCPMSVGIAAQLIADDMPDGREVSPSTVRQKFYDSKKLVEKADLEALFSGLD